ncbi:Capsid protein VP4 [Popillia japonica]|uniref:Capsid protein VP4 n=1 Tax=Popillia japonica TaxID=7064 RepID=A0AAW1HSU7_POPJA
MSTATIAETSASLSALTISVTGLETVPAFAAISTRFSNLSNTRSRRKVIPKGVRCSFDVGTTLTGSANSMHVIFGKHCIGLNQKFDITNMSLKPNDKSPMTISEIGDISANEFTHRFYGNITDYHSSTTATNYPTSWGANRALPYYACIMATTNESTKNKYHVNSGWPRIDNIMDKYNLNEHINIPIIKYSYKPRNGILKQTNIT